MQLGCQTFLPFDYVLNFTATDSDKEREEEPDYTEEGSYTTFLCTQLSCQ